MRVLMLSWEYPPVLVGGLGRHVDALSKALAKQGNEVTVVTRHAPDAPAEEIRDGVRVVRTTGEPPSFPLSTPTLLAWTMAFNHGVTRTAQRLARSEQFDVIHAHDWLVAHAAVTLKEQLNLPLIATIHATEAGRHQGHVSGELSEAIHSIEEWLVSEADRVVACSHYMRWEVHRLLRVPASRIDVVPNGVDAYDLRPEEQVVRAARARYARTGALVGFAGRLVYEKGVQDILHALPGLRERHPGLRLVVAGDGPYRSELQDQVRALRLEPAVSFTGFLNGELISVMASTDAMIVPSRYEPFGMVALEAAAAGVPVAAAATGGLKEIVEPGRTGMTFPPGDATALANAVSRLLGNAEASRRMVRTARHMVAVRYAWDPVAARTVRVYQAAVAATRPAAAVTPHRAESTARPAAPRVPAHSRPQPTAVMQRAT